MVAFWWASQQTLPMKRSNWNAKFGTLITVALASVTPAIAQEAPATPDPDTNAIVVLGQPLPLPPGTPAYGSVVIPRDRLTNDASGRIENILTDVAGFQQFRRSDSRSANPSAQGATLRALGGNASSRALVLLDGVPQADPFFGYIPFSALVPDRLGAVRITRGGGAGAFGAGAVAGTIELASAEQADVSPLSASAFYGSRNASEVSVSASPTLGSGFVTVSARWDRGDGFFTTPRAQRGPADVPAKYEGGSLSLRAVAPLGPDTEVQARVLAFRDDRTLRFAGADNSSEGQDASVRILHRGDWQADVIGYVQSRNFSNKVISATSFRKVLDQRNTPSTGIGGKIELRPPVGAAHVLRIGADARLARGDMYEDAFNGGTGALTFRRHAGGHSSTLGLFVENDWTLGRLIITGGARVDRWTITRGFFQERNAAGIFTQNNDFAARNDWQATGRGGVLFNVSDSVALRTAAYTGFRLPTLNELYRPFAVFPVITRANAALAPEKLKGVEAGFDLTPLPGVALGATVFYNKLNNAIANVTIGTNLRERRNVDAIVAKGVELTATARTGAILFNASYAYSHATVRGSGASLALDGFTPAQSPRHAASVTLAYAPQSGPSLSVTARYVGKQFEDDRETDALPDALTVDGVARVPLTRKLALVARAENLFDATVITRNAGGTQDLGTPRTFWIGVRFGE